MSTQVFRPINPEVFANLEMVDDRVYNLPGGVGRRWTNEVDPRLSGLLKSGTTPVGDNVPYFEHIGTVRDKKTKVFYVAFRETGDAQLARESDLVKYPEWLMKNPKKIKERMVYIYMVMRHPKDVPVMRSQEDWLSPIPDPTVFDTVWQFLARHNIVPAQ